MQILAKYYSYLERNPDSLLCRYLGLYRIRPRKCYVVVTANVLSSTRKIDKVLAACMLSRECLGLIRVAATKKALPAHRPHRPHRLLGTACRRSMMVFGSSMIGAIVHQARCLVQ